MEWLHKLDKEEPFLSVASPPDFLQHSRSRYIGLRKTHLGHVAVAAEVNVIQLMSWLGGEAPEQTRTSPFKQVMKPAA